jgi:hypothetical protein
MQRTHPHGAFLLRAVQTPAQEVKLPVTFNRARLTNTRLMEAGYPTGHEAVSCEPAKLQA